jgi:hypothetical protein
MWAGEMIEGIKKKFGTVSWRGKEKEEKKTVVKRNKRDQRRGKIYLEAVGRERKQEGGEDKKRETK